MSKNIQKIIAFVINFLLFSSISSYANKIKYYRDYSISTWDYSVIPRDSLSEKIAMKSICNKFIYDDNGKLVLILGFAFGLNFTDTYHKVNKIKFEYTKDGFIKTFFDDDEKPMQSEKNGVFGEEIVRDSNGYRVYFLNENGHRTINQHDIYVITHLVDQQRHWVEQRYYDQNNHPVKNEQGVYQTRFKFNSQKQVVEARFYNDNDQLMKNNLNYAIIKYRYNIISEQIEKSVFDASGKPASSFPFKIFRQKKINNEWKRYDRNNEPIFLFFSDRFKPGEPDSINYDLVVKLTMQDLMFNIASVGIQSARTFNYRLNFNNNKADSLVAEYYYRWHSKLDSLKREGTIFKQGSFFDYFSSIGER